MFKAIWDWLEERTGLPSGIEHFLNEDIPASAGWHQVFGSVALFAFLIQVATGLLLALNFGSTPSEAHASVRYITTQVTGGALIRGLHHWGSSAMIIVVVLHLVQVFVWGAYKKPREATWMVGCVLLLLTLAFGLTGYLLPWDNKAYWATTVTAHISALPPGAGPYVSQLLGVQGGAIGVITFARFYAAHIMLLPLVTALLIGFHVFLVRKHGVTPIPEDAEKPKKKFFPEQVFKDTIAAFAYTLGLVLMASLVKVGLGAMADPTDTSFTPRPEWYFLFLFQTLKLFEGPLEVVGAVILPTIGMIALICTPFIDRGIAMRVQKRTFAIGLAAFAAIGWAALTQRAVATTPAELDPEIGLKPPALWQQVPAEQVAAVGYFRQDNCGRCHVLGRSGAGPDLSREASNEPADWLLDHFAKPAPDGPDSTLNTAQMKALVTLVTKRDEKGLDAWATAPDDAVHGAMLFQNRQCFLCHQLNGVGGTLGPVMNGLNTRRTRDWIMGHFGDPKKFVQGSKMPAYKLPPQELAQVTDYLLAIPK